jgi:hypothetical protein
MSAQNRGFSAPKQNFRNGNVMNNIYFNNFFPVNMHPIMNINCVNIFMNQGVDKCNINQNQVNNNRINNNNIINNFNNNMNNFNNNNNMNNFNNNNMKNFNNSINNLNNNNNINNFNSINNFNNNNNNNHNFNNMNNFNNNMNNFCNNNMNNFNNNMNNFCNNNNFNNNNMNNFNDNGMNNFHNIRMNNFMSKNQNNNFIKPVINQQNCNFAFPFKKKYSAGIPTNNMMDIGINNNNIKLSNSINNNINITLSFISSEQFIITGKSYETLSEIINRFKNKTCPERLKKYLSFCLFDGRHIDQNKTLQDLGIKNGSKILFVKNKNKKNEYVMNRREYLEYYKHRGEYFCLKILNDIENQKNYLSPSLFQSYASFYNSKDKSYGISTNVHHHLLVYCLSNFNWKCTICNLNYDKKYGRYYCSRCNFNLCENCNHNKKYTMKKSFPENIDPSNNNIKENFIKTDYHDDMLVYCRSSKNLTYFNDWICANCNASYSNDIWSFYCTLCNYHLCCRCCGYL